MEKVKVKMLTGIAGLANPAYDLPEHSYAPEQIVMLHPKLAEAWVAGGIAQGVREKPSAPLAHIGNIPVSQEILNDAGLEHLASGAPTIDASSEVVAKSSPKTGKSSGKK